MCTNSRTRKRKYEHEVVRILKKKKQWLLRTKWHRIILDEAHIIRNKATRNHKACKMIQAKHRWALTGTPIPNSQNDAFGLTAFLRTDTHLNDGGIFHRAVARPIKHGKTLRERRMGLSRLRLLFKTISIRRTKKILTGKLPSKTIVVKKIVLDKKTREIYDLIQSASQYVFFFDSLDLSLSLSSRLDSDFPTRSNTHTHTHKQIRSTSHDRSRCGATKFSFHSCACDSSETGMSGSISSSRGYHRCDE